MVSTIKKSFSLRMCNFQLGHPTLQRLSQRKSLLQWKEKFGRKYILGLSGSATEPYKCIQLYNPHIYGKPLSQQGKFYKIKHTTTALYQCTLTLHYSNALYFLIHIILIFLMFYIFITIWRCDSLVVIYIYTYEYLDGIRLYYGLNGWKNTQGE